MYSNNESSFPDTTISKYNDFPTFLVHMPKHKEMKKYCTSCVIKRPCMRIVDNKLEGAVIEA
jgi:hypothetical protein